MADEGNRPGFFAGLFLGGLIGAVAGFLLSPQPGERTRERLRSKADEFIARGGEVIKDAVKEGKEATVKAVSDLQTKFEEAKQKSESKDN